MGPIIRMAMPILAFVLPNDRQRVFLGQRIGDGIGVD